MGVRSSNLLGSTTSARKPGQRQRSIFPKFKFPSFKFPTFKISDVLNLRGSLQILNASNHLLIPEVQCFRFVEYSKIGCVLRIRSSEKPTCRSCSPDGDFLPSQFSLTRFLCLESGGFSLRVPESIVLRLPRFVGWALLLLVSCWSMGGGAGNVGV